MTVEQLKELSATMKLWSASCGDHHWMAHLAIEELIGKRREHNLVQQLEVVIGAIWKNSEQFLNDVYPEHRNCDELINFYMADENCNVVVLTREGATYTDTVKTSTVLEWYHRLLQKGNNVV
jgi:hypothetical protein